ncbi:MAG TPA: bifunctional phosphoribosylaminoimidazolecarboxamide formyltransferase/IMP cyclohydrolase [Elusimicrobiota bacterium]|nr:bifunctional phosphoribosylaminoimidazolecarboxamide formyltransferase/IMP cyclohydrolase [Elusimicrobiota bacterium]
MSAAPKRRLPGTGRTALLSVSDKSGIADFAHGLSELGYTLLSSGGTAQTLRQAELEVQDVRELTDFPDIFGGRLRLLHPRLFAGIMADRDSAEQARDLTSQEVPPIDLVVVNLYPLSELLGPGKLEQKEILDFLDASGAALLRAAARNFHHVVALCDPRDYPSVLESLRERGSLSRERSQALAAKAFYYVAYYDSTVAQYLSRTMERLPDELLVALKKSADLRYGENPHQEAALYSLSGARAWGLSAATLLHGKPLSFNHYLGMDRAAELAGEFQSPACAIVKHANPAGVAVSERPGEAARLAYKSDPAGCTGGVAAFNRPLDAEAARLLAPEYLECIVAPEFSPEAVDLLRPKKDVRLVALPSMLLSPNEIEIKTISGGVLVQDKDNPKSASLSKCVTRRAPTELESASLDFAWRVAKHSTTHAAVLARGTATFGIGSGQTARLDAVRLALVKSQDRHPIVSGQLPQVLASDGPLGAAHIKEASQAGVSAVIQPGGSSEDADAIRFCDESGLAMVFTGIRHFRH